MPTIRYLEFPKTTNFGDTITMPVTLNLPCYGNVQVTMTPIATTPATLLDATKVYNQSAGGYSWWKDANPFNVWNAPIAGTNIKYTVTFTFLDPAGAPDLAKLFLIISALAQNTTAKVSVPGTLVGEYQVPYPLDTNRLGTATTRLIGQTLSSDAFTSGADRWNTGWALYQPSVLIPTMPYPSFSVDIDQESGDGIQWTLGYVCDKWCCPGKNLVVNGDFELADFSGFSSAYDFNEPNPADPRDLQPTLPGEYSIVTAARAVTIIGSPAWVAEDHYACKSRSGTGSFMVVNGKTCQKGSEIIWKETIPVQDGQEYRFCAYFKNFPQCTFDVLPIIEVKFSEPSYNIPPTVVNTKPSDPCAWQLISGSVTMPTRHTSLTIEIWLDETGLGDGNDLAIDDISLQAKSAMNPAYVLVNFSPPTKLGSGLWGITANPINLPAGYGYWWDVSEVDCKTHRPVGTDQQNPPAWWTIPCQFDTYDGKGGLSGTGPGQFDFTNKCYRIRFGAWSDCVAWSESDYILQFNTLLKKVEIVRNQSAQGRPLPPINRGKAIAGATARLVQIPPTPGSSEVG